MALVAAAAMKASPLTQEWSSMLFARLHASRCAHTCYCRPLCSQHLHACKTHALMTSGPEHELHTLHMCVHSAVYARRCCESDLFQSTCRSDDVTRDIVEVGMDLHGVRCDRSLRAVHACTGCSSISPPQWTPTTGHSCLYG